MLRNKIGPVFNARHGSFFVSFAFLLRKILFFLQGENEVFKNKKQKMDQFLTLEKAKIGPVFNSTAYIYMYIYIYAVESIIWPSLGVFKVNN